MRIAIATVQVPFVRGGAEILAEGLRDALVAHGHEADVVTIPFQWNPVERVLDHMVMGRLMDLTHVHGRPIDRVVALKFPAYLAPHPQKVVWLVHQHRAAYDLWDAGRSELRDAPMGQAVRQSIMAADEAALGEAAEVFTISRQVSARLRRHNGLEAAHLYPPPPGAALFVAEAAEDYVFCPSRIGPAKRQALLLEALARCRRPVALAFAGEAEHPAHLAELTALARRLGVEGRVRFLGGIPEADKRRWYARARAVAFVPFLEDYGYVTAEAMLAARPVVTTTDAGGPLEWVEEGVTGLVAEPTAPAIAACLDRLWADPAAAAAMGRAGRERYLAAEVTWERVVRTLVP